MSGKGGNLTLLLHFILLSNIFHGESITTITTYKEQTNFNH